ncbi:DUF2207 domain-containing protein [Corynebacterium epidermidicanis]|uniref:Uncharacterized protein n=1 Tax=Corynebacterium epidermidicanis TaxID=1050174 RepID=A0A0G3GTX3_9CORY|nr:hypothetical protein [Corynebacterium epidermidicanis]AKK02287.1 hypothetical protein CEPID_02030 [Corynebacterium epidermidicanis]
MSWKTRGKGSTLFGLLLVSVIPCLQLVLVSVAMRRRPKHTVRLFPDDDIEAIASLAGDAKRLVLADVVYFVDQGFVRPSGDMLYVTRLRPKSATSLQRSILGALSRGSLDLGETPARVRQQRRDELIELDPIHRRLGRLAVGLIGLSVITGFAGAAMAEQILLLPVSIVSSGILGLVVLQRTRGGTSSQAFDVDKPATSRAHLAALNGEADPLVMRASWELLAGVRLDTSESSTTVESYA